MIVEKNVFNDPDGSVGYIECIYNSENVLMSIFFPKTNILYISFNRGHTYKYLNINEEKYKEFENSESQGKFFFKEINNKKEHPHSREYNLYQNELEFAKNIIKEWKEKNQQS